MATTPASGGGPGDHPGVKLVQMTGRLDIDQTLLESAFENPGYKLAGFYAAVGVTFAVFTSGY